MRLSLGFRCSINSLYSDNLSLFYNLKFEIFDADGSAFGGSAPPNFVVPRKIYVKHKTKIFPAEKVFGSPKT